MAGAGVVVADVGETEKEGLLHSSKFFYLICPIWASNKSNIYSTCPNHIDPTDWIPLKNEWLTIDILYILILGKLEVLNIFLSNYNEYRWKVIFYALCLQESACTTQSLQKKFITFHNWLEMVQPPSNNISWLKGIYISKKIQGD